MGEVGIFGGDIGKSAARLRNFADSGFGWHIAILSNSVRLNFPSDAYLAVKVNCDGDWENQWKRQKLPKQKQNARKNYGLSEHYRSLGVETVFRTTLIGDS